MRPNTPRHVRPLLFRPAFALSALLATACTADDAATADTAADAPAADEAATITELPTVRIVEPADGAELSTTDVLVRLEADGITILPAGDTTPNSGHHHLFLNAEATAEGQPIPAGDPAIVHLGQGQTEYTFAGLAPGEYTLIARIGDLAHRVLPQAADTVQFSVVADGM